MSNEQSPAPVAGIGIVEDARQLIEAWERRPRSGVPSEAATLESLQRHTYTDEFAALASAAPRLVRGLLQAQAAYRLAAQQMHNGLVGAGMAGAFNASLAEDGVRLFDQAEAQYQATNLHAEDVPEILSWKGKAEAAEARAASLEQQIARAEHKGRLAALEAVHDRYEFGPERTIEAFDTWLHERIIAARFLLDSLPTGQG